MNRLGVALTEGVVGGALPDGFGPGVDGMSQTLCNRGSGNAFDSDRKELLPRRMLTIDDYSFSFALVGRQ